MGVLSVKIQNLETFSLDAKKETQLEIRHEIGKQLPLIDALYPKIDAVRSEVV